jgi:N-acyl-D-aspartate/D-glutamate deacylase
MSYVPRLALLLAAFVVACTAVPEYDLIIRNGTVYDGSGSPGVTADVAVRGDRIAAVGGLGRARGRAELDAGGLAVSPGFINVLSWATDSLIADGRSQGDIRQGVTLEVFGEGWSMGPLSEEMRRMKLRQRGRLEAGYYADVVVFDPARVQDHATFDQPHQYSTGILHVWVNGTQVLKNGEHTGATPGRVVRGPGWEGM